MNNTLSQLKSEIYDKIGLSISKLEMEVESKGYEACRYQLDDFQIISRTAKITPKKAGQFVTFWKRNENGPIEPFRDTDEIDFFLVNVRSANKFGQFVFPKSVLIQKGVLSTDKKEGKRAFRVYPKWDLVNNKQAEKTQNWQVNYFYEINPEMDLESILKMFK